MLVNPVNSLNDLNTDVVLFQNSVLKVRFDVMGFGLKLDSKERFPVLFYQFI